MAPSRAHIDDDDDDPVTAEYDVFITPQLAEQIYLLQYPNRDRRQPYSEAFNSKPLEMRIKPKSGFIEVDVPMNVHANFDKTKGIKWGEALRKAKEEGAVGYGIAAGFNSRSGSARAGWPARGGGTARDDEESEDEAFEKLLRNFDDANDKGHVMNTQTLGGQIIRNEVGKPVYMLGAFRGKELHLTKVTGVVQMRPQFHHLDAQSQQADAARRRERAAAEPPRATEPRAVQMIAKGADDEDINMTSTKAFLDLAHSEPWTKLRYHDEETDDSYAVYHEKLFVQDTAGAPKLVSTMINEEYLDAISAPRVDPSGRTKKKPLTKRQMRAVDESDESDVPVEEATVPVEEATVPGEPSGQQDGVDRVADGRGTAMDLDETETAP